MNKRTLEYIESQLEDRGYKKWTTCKTTDKTAYEYMKTVKPQDYIISFRVWDWEKYRIGDGYSIDIDIIYSFDYIRVDLTLTHEEDIDLIERLAQANYELLKKFYEDNDTTTESTKS